MKKYEAMFIARPGLSEDEQKALLHQIQEVVAKNKGSVSHAGLWQEKKALYFKIKKYNEGIYYLVNFSAGDSASIALMRRAWNLNENILRTLITLIE